MFKHGFVAQYEKDLVAQLKSASFDKAFLLQKIQQLEKQVQPIPEKMEVCYEVQSLFQRQVNKLLPQYQRR